jgi:hypothetical protein
LQPVQREPTVDRALEEALSSRGASAKKTSSAGDVINMLRSSNLKDKEEAAKIALKQYKNDPAVLDVVNEELLKGYTSNSGNREFVEAMAWLCNALGESGQAKYASTLEKVSQEAPNRKLQKYALKNLRHFK